MTIDIVRADERGVALAARHLAEGGLVIHPTETVVSLSGDPYAQRAVDRARSLKGYAEPRPFLLLVADVASARALAGTWPAAAARLAESFWPGSLTLVVAAASEGPDPVSADGRLALRPASDPVSLAILEAFGGPVFSTSANRRGDDAATSVDEALDSLGLRSAAAEPDGGRGGARASDRTSVPIVALETSAPVVPAGSRSVASTIVDVTVDPPRLVRRGAISADRIREALSDRLEE